MAIPESQLDTWSRQGSITQSSGTYQSIRAALLKDSAAYAVKRPEVFLQGSYGNDTNIYAESDVDCVILYNGAFYYDLDALPADQQALFNASMGSGTYSYNTFKAEVLAALTRSFGASVDPNSRRAIKIKAGGGRRSADVIVAFQFRRYYMFKGDDDQRFDTGITARAFDGVDDLSGGIRAFRVSDGDARPVSSKVLGNCGADAARSTGDESDFVGEF